LDASSFKLLKIQYGHNEARAHAHVLSIIFIYYIKKKAPHATEASGI